MADRFHLLQNLLGYMKDIFREDMPSKIYIQNRKISEKEPEKILKEKTPENSFLESLHYDNTPPVDSSGNVVVFDNKKHDLNSAQCRRQEEMRKKTTIDQRYKGLLERAGKTTDKKCGRDFRNSTADGNLFLYQASA